MKTYCAIALQLMVLFNFIACKSNSDDVTSTSTTNEIEVFETAKIVLDISYGDHDQQTYDLYLPAGRTSNSTKTLILVHGGGWTSGDKSDMSLFIQMLQTAHPDHAIVNMNYILAQPPSVPAFPNQIVAIDKVINHLIENGEVNGTTKDFALLGVSAGAHLAMMYDYTYDTEDHVKFVANIVGPADFTDPYYANNPDTAQLTSWFADEDAYAVNADLPVLLSPAQAVTSSSSPTLLFYGNEDPLVPLSNGQRLDVALSNYGVDHLFTVYDGGHGNWDTNSYLDLKTKLSTYIRTYLAVDQ